MLPEVLTKEKRNVRKQDPFIPPSISQPTFKGGVLKWVKTATIEWCDHTFNPWMGCQHVSPGCDHCYAEDMMDRRYGKVQWGPHGAAQAHVRRELEQPTPLERGGTCFFSSVRSSAPSVLRFPCRLAR